MWKLGVLGTFKRRKDGCGWVWVRVCLCGGRGRVAALTDAVENGWESTGKLYTIWFVPSEQISCTTKKISLLLSYMAHRDNSRK